MTLIREVEVLRDIPLFAEVEQAKLKLLAFTSERLQYRSGDELFHQGDFGDAAYIVLQGKADILVDTRRARSRSRRSARATSSARSRSCATCRAPRRWSASDLETCGWPRTASSTW